MKLAYRRGLFALGFDGGARGGGWWHRAHIAQPLDGRLELIDAARKRHIKRKVIHQGMDRECRARLRFLRRYLGLVWEQFVDRCKRRLRVSVACVGVCAGVTGDDARGGFRGCDGAKAGATEAAPLAGVGGGTRVPCGRGVGAGGFISRRLTCSPSSRPKALLNSAAEAKERAGSSACLSTSLPSSESVDSGV